MIYQKPVVVTLGDAARLIEGLKSGPSPESLLRPHTTSLVAVYGLDD